MRLIAIILTALLTFSNSTLCFADTNNVKSYSFKNDISMNGVISSAGRFFNVEDNWNVLNAKLNLVFTKSELLDIEYSTITVLINDTPIQSQRLDGNKEYKKEISIEIPSDLLNSGYNEVKVKAYKTISDKVCRDDANTANWLVIHKESNINIQYRYKEINNFLSQYPKIYFNIDDGSRLNTTILMPDNYISSELTSAMIISSDFGKKLKYDSFSFDVKLYSDFKNKDDNVIYIGKGSNTPKEILSLLNDNEKNSLNDNCVLKQVTSSLNKNKKRLFIISNNDELLIKGAKLLTSNDLVNNLTLESVLINKSSDVKDLVQNQNLNKVRLQDLGYENILLKGPFSQETTIDINTPKSKVVTDGSKIRLYVRYAQNLDFERSLMTVYVNEIPIGSKKLYKEKCDDDIFEINLPQEVIGANYYQIKVLFNLNVLDGECVTRDTDNPWAYIANDSFIEFNYDDNKNLSFSSYTYPFIVDGSFNDVKIIVPSNSGSKELTNIASIVTYMGRELNYNYGTLLAIKENEFSDKYKNGNIIAIGTPSDSSIIKDINNNLNLKFNANFNGFDSNNKIKFIGKYPEEIATVQLITSPYDKSKATMVLTATSSDDLSLGTKVLSDLSVVKNLRGDTIVINKERNIEDLSYNIKTTNTNDEVINNKEIRKKELSNQTKIFFIIAIFLLITLIASSVLLIKKNKK